MNIPRSCLLILWFVAGCPRGSTVWFMSYCSSGIQAFAGLEYGAVSFDATAICDAHLRTWRLETFRRSLALWVLRINKPGPWAVSLRGYHFRSSLSALSFPLTKQGLSNPPQSGVDIVDGYLRLATTYHKMVQSCPINVCWWRIRHPGFAFAMAKEVS